MDVSVESTLCDDSDGQLLVELFNVQIDLEQNSVCGADYLAEIAKAFVGDVGAVSDGEVSQLSIPLEVMSKLSQPVIREHVLVKDDRAEVWTCADVVGQNTDGLVVEACIGEVNCSDVEILDQFEGWLDQF